MDLRAFLFFLFFFYPFLVGHFVFAQLKFCCKFQQPKETKEDQPVSEYTAEYCISWENMMDRRIRTNQCSLCSSSPRTQTYFRSSLLSTRLSELLLGEETRRPEICRLAQLASFFSFFRACKKALAVFPFFPLAKQTTSYAGYNQRGVDTLLC